MEIAKVSLPLYKSNRSKKSKTLINMNWYRNAGYYLENSVKKAYLGWITHKIGYNKHLPYDGEYKITATLYYRNKQMDLDNISVLIKYLNDALQHLGYVEQDNIQQNTQIVYVVGGEDKEFPRLDVSVEGI